MSSFAPNARDPLCRCVSRVEQGFTPPHQSGTGVSPTPDPEWNKVAWYENVQPTHHIYTRVVHTVRPVRYGAQIPHTPEGVSAV